MFGGRSGEATVGLRDPRGASVVLVFQLFCSFEIFQNKESEMKKRERARERFELVLPPAGCERVQFPSKLSGGPLALTVGLDWAIGPVSLLTRLSSASAQPFNQQPRPAERCPQWGGGDLDWNSHLAIPQLGGRGGSPGALQVLSCQAGAAALRGPERTKV